MPPLRRRSSSVFDFSQQEKESKPSVLDITFNLFDRQLSVGIFIGIVLSIAPIILQCIAYSTAHWKEVTPNTHSLYIDSVDALIRKEVLVYFNTVHRFTRHSYGLFHRCEYAFVNASKSIQRQGESLQFSSNRLVKTCTKNYLPLYDDDKFNDCHSLQYYRFCSQSNERYFNIDDDYLRATFDINIKSNLIIASMPFCHCSYPRYIQFCQVFGALGLTFLCLTTILFTIFPWMKKRSSQVLVKCFAVLFSLFAMAFILINLLLVSNYFDFELIEYLKNIERHYHSNQIYQFSLDLKYAIERFLSSIRITAGYSMKISWLALILSIIDGILLMTTCKINGDYQNINALFSAIPILPSQEDHRRASEDYGGSITALPTETDQTRIIPNILITGCDRQPSPDTPPPRSCLKRGGSPRIHFVDERKSS